MILRIHLYSMYRVTDSASSDLDVSSEKGQSRGGLSLTILESASCERTLDEWKPPEVAASPKPGTEMSGTMYLHSPSSLGSASDSESLHASDCRKEGNEVEEGTWQFEIGHLSKRGGRQTHS